jgi:hypothetical protein
MAKKFLEFSDLGQKNFRVSFDVNMLATDFTDFADSI